MLKYKLDKIYVEVYTMKTKEKIWQSRRIWASALTLVVTIGMVALPDNTELVIMLGGFIASALGISSWTYPKK
jgi:hypothetical protein